MPYKDPEKQKAAQHASYLRHRETIYARQVERRQQPGYRDQEYETRRSADAERRESRPAPRSGGAEAASAPHERVRAERLTPQERALRDEAEAALETQRRLKAQALARMSARHDESEGKR